MIRYVPLPYIKRIGFLHYQVVAYTNRGQYFVYAECLTKGQGRRIVDKLVRMYDYSSGGSTRPRCPLKGVQDWTEAMITVDRTLRAAKLLDQRAEFLREFVWCQGWEPFWEIAHRYVEVY